MLLSLSLEERLTDLKKHSLFTTFSIQTKVVKMFLGYQAIIKKTEKEAHIRNVVLLWQVFFFGPKNPCQRSYEISLTEGTKRDS